MYFPDLTDYAYLSRVDTLTERILNIGWLGRDHSFPCGEVPIAFADALLLLCRSGVNSMFGYHRCELCDDAPFGIAVSADDTTYTLGGKEIWVKGRNGVIYAAPDLIYHYVLTHNYKPSAEYIDSVIESNGVGMGPAIGSAWTEFWNGPGFPTP